VLRQAEGTRTRPRPWLAGPVLGLQAAASLRTARADGPTFGERTTLAAGHAEIARWLGGAPAAVLPTHLPGTAGVYPALAAAAYGAGGLLMARGVSLLFALSATALLWSLAARLAGWRAAVVTTALSAAMVTDLRLGATVSADAASLCMLVLALWCACHAGTRSDETWWMLAAAAAMVLANVVAYPSVLADPVVVVTAGLTAWPMPGGKYGVMRAMSVASLTVTPTVLLLTADGGYGSGIRSAAAGVLDAHRPIPDTPVRALAWLVVAMALATVVGWGALKLEPHRQALLVVLLPGGLVVPLVLAGVLAGTSAALLAAAGTCMAAVAIGVAAEAALRAPRAREQLPPATTSAEFAVVRQRPSRRLATLPLATGGRG
jgi:hypothetical protein